MIRTQGVSNKLSKRRFIVVNVFIVLLCSKAFSENIDFEKVDWYAKRASVAYLSESEIRKHFPNTVLVATTKANVQYFLENNPQQKTQILVIRGTDNLANAREDADYVESQNKKLGIVVHKGFDADAQEIYQAVQPYLDKKQKIYLTGHSLGAAISSLLMMYLYEDDYQIGLSINFGQPKLTNKHGAQKYQFLPLLRVVDENDVVPLVPPTDLIDAIHGGYEHFGAEIILLAGEYYVYENNHISRELSADAFWKNMGDESVEEHYMKNYLKNIQSKIRKSRQVSYKDREKYLGK